MSLRECSAGEAEETYSFSPSAAVTGEGIAEQGEAPQLAIWGSGAVSSFGGQEDGLSLDGSVTTALVGADWSGLQWQAGAAVARSRGTGSYRGTGEEEGDTAVGGDGEISTTLTGLFPYGRYAVTPEVGLWAMGGYGWGTLRLRPGGGREELNTTTNLVMGAVGLEGLVVDGGADGLSITTIMDGLLVETTSQEVDGLAGSGATATRLRVGLEAGRPIPLADGASILPSVEVGFRSDGGDAETGLGVDIGAAVAYNNPQQGISTAISARSLVTHGSEAFRQQGMSFSFAWQPDPSDRGVSLSLEHTMGIPTTEGIDALLNPVVIQHFDGTGSDGHHLQAQLAYGLPAADDRLTITPALVLALSPSSSSYTLQWALTPYAPQHLDPPWHLNLAVEQLLSPSSPPQHSLSLLLSYPL